MPFWTKEQFTVASTVITAMASYFTDVKKVEVFKLSFNLSFELSFNLRIT